MSWPFDQSTTPYAYVAATHSSGYSHMRVRVRNLPGMDGFYSASNGSMLAFDNQAGGQHRSADMEPFYAWRTGVVGFEDVLGLEQLQCAAKSLAVVIKRLRAADEVAGAPASLIEDYIVRLLRACRVEHVYVESRVNSRSDVDTWDRYTPDRFDLLHGALQCRKRELLTCCGWLREAA